eukprot:599574-Rhodomonas_salina.2
MPFTHARPFAKKEPGQAAAGHDRGCHAGRVKRHDGCGDVLLQVCPRREQSRAPAAVKSWPSRIAACCAVPTTGAGTAKSGARMGNAEAENAEICAEYGVMR